MSPRTSDDSSYNDDAPVGRYSIDRSRVSRTSRMRRAAGGAGQGGIEEPRPRESGVKRERADGGGKNGEEKAGTKRGAIGKREERKVRQKKIPGREAGIEDAESVGETPSGSRPAEHRPSVHLKDHPKMMAVLVVVVIILLVSRFPPWENDGDPDPDPISVRVPDRMIGDISVYRVDGRLSTASNGNGGEEFSLDFEFMSNSRTTIETSGFKNITDGFGASHMALETRTTHKLSLTGKANTERYKNVEITGNSHMTITDRSYAVDENTTIASRVTTDMFIEVKKFGGTEEYESRDDAHLFPNLFNLSSQGGLESIYRTRNLSRGDSDNLTIGNLDFRWAVNKQKEIAGEQALRIAISISSEDLEKANEQSDTFFLKNIYMNTWVANRYPMPVQNEIFVSGIYNTSDASQEVELHYIITLLEKQSVRGTESIEYQPFDIPDRNAFEERDHWFLDRMPSHGAEKNSSIRNDFTAEHAYEKAYNESGDFRDFMDGHPSAYLVLALYNETENDPRWNLTFAGKGAGKGYHIVVHRHRIEDGEGVMELSDVQFGLSVDYSRGELEVPKPYPITFAGFEQVLRNDSWINGELYSDGNLHFDEVTLRLQTNLVYPGIDLTKMFIQFDFSRYAYAVNKGDRFTAAVDAETGQFLFIISHEGDGLY